MDKEVVIRVVDSLEQPLHLPKCPSMNGQQEHHPRSEDGMVETNTSLEVFLYIVRGNSVAGYTGRK